jgi:hypothetical protein
MKEQQAEKKRRKQTSPIEVRLRPDDLAAFDQLCRVSNRKRPEVAREAILWYMEQQAKKVQDVRESKLELRIRKMENRMAALISRGNIDTGVLLEIISANMPGADRDAVLKRSHKRAAMRLKRKVDEVDDIADLFKNELAKADTFEEV